MPQGAHKYSITVHWSSDQKEYRAFSPSWYDDDYLIDEARGNTPAEALQRMYDIINEELEKPRPGYPSPPRPILPIIHEEAFYWILAELAEYKKSDNPEVRYIGEIAQEAITSFHTPLSFNIGNNPYRHPKGSHQYAVTVYWAQEAEAFRGKCTDWYYLSVTGETPTEALQRMYENLDERLNNRDPAVADAPWSSGWGIAVEDFYDVLAEIAEYAESDDNLDARELGGKALNALNSYHASPSAYYYRIPDSLTSM